jgi:hypothetical protein
VFASRIRLLLAVFWAGSLWTIGYLAAPTLFMTLQDKALAGTLAGSLFRSEAWVSVVCGVALMTLVAIAATDDVAQRSTRRTLLVLISCMLVCTLVGYFGLQPMMASVREAAGPSGIAASGLAARFGILHGIASGIYLIQSLCGIALVLKIR